MFTGLSAFPVTPFRYDRLDLPAMSVLLANLSAARPDSICVMGSTGLYPYLTPAEKQQVIQLAVEQSDGIPVMAGIGALLTREVLANAQQAQQAGASALLLAPVAYHPLNSDEVYHLFEQVCREVSVPVCVYENPGTTQFSFSDELYAAITRLPHISAIKIPGAPFGSAEEGAARLTRLRAIIPEHVAVGVSADKFGVAGMLAGCDCWLSVAGGLFPNTIKSLIDAVHHTPHQAAEKASVLEPLWDLFTHNKGGLRVIATAADLLGYTEGNCLPAPLLPLTGDARQQLAKVLSRLELR
ncbi:dihydrodipicolinate synthase family protein [Salinimonas lutimaris]|uniref:dihydrodipicolinate synthase family protein n=1 Tax=Salinimonas lutimaris TaxID=914153 RepID=UPI0010C08F78|nr:dihydrodipicolinate synthase family protein [Salinimonas lutimaris]